jgi:hypothetical protein
MSLQLSSAQVWTVLEKELFAVLGVVNASGEARTSGVVYTVRDFKLHIATSEDTWKAVHTRENPHVSITVPIVKRIPLMPWIRIPAATVSFNGLGSVQEPDDVQPAVLKALLHGLEKDEELLETMCIISVEPVGEFITYGVGVPLMAMRDGKKARGRAPVRATP